MSSSCLWAGQLPFTCCHSPPQFLHVPVDGCWRPFFRSLSISVTLKLLISSCLPAINKPLSVSDGSRNACLRIRLEDPFRTIYRLAYFQSPHFRTGTVLLSYATGCGTGERDSLFSWAAWRSLSTSYRRCFWGSKYSFNFATAESKSSPASWNWQNISRTREPAWYNRKARCRF